MENEGKLAGHSEDFSRKRVNKEKRKHQSEGRRVLEVNTIVGNDIFAEESLRNRKRKTRVNHDDGSSTTVKPTTMRSTPHVTKSSDSVTRGFFITRRDFENAPTTTSIEEFSTTDTSDFITQDDSTFPTDVSTTIENLATTESAFDDANTDLVKTDSNVENVEFGTLSSIPDDPSATSSFPTTSTETSKDTSSPTTLESTTISASRDFTTVESTSTSIATSTSLPESMAEENLKDPSERLPSTLSPVIGTDSAGGLELNLPTTTQPRLRDIPNEANDSSSTEGSNIEKNRGKIATSRNQHETSARRTNGHHRRVLNRTTNIGSRRHIVHHAIPGIAYPRHRATSNRGRVRYRGSKRVSSTTPSSLAESTNVSSLSTLANNTFNINSTRKYLDNLGDTTLLISAATSSPFLDTYLDSVTASTSSLDNSHIPKHTTVSYDNSEDASKESKEALPIAGGTQISHFHVNNTSDPTEDTTAVLDMAEKLHPRDLRVNNISSPVNEVITMGPSSRISGSQKRTQLYNTLRDKSYTPPLISLLPTTKYPSTIGYRKTYTTEPTLLTIQVDDANQAGKSQETTPNSYLQYGIDKHQKTESNDQSSRAQEIALSLSDPPSSQTSSSNTGQPSFKETYRRKISTTVAPRKTSPSFPLSTLKQTTIFSKRPQLKVKETYPEIPISRPKRPQIIDYDYYADEAEPIVGKSAFNGKLYLTNSGRIQCLDQGNFPHPFSCKKFITCARMVNGLVIGSEYTCPDKLSFDPVGGICNWSAGLGCKE